MRRIWVLISLLFIMIASPSAMAIVNNRPVEGDQPTVIRTSVFLLDVDDIDTAHQNFEANVYYECHWHDKRLAHGGPGNMRKHLDEVWHPNLQFLNQQRVWSTFPKIVKITPSGEVSYRQRVWGSFSQPLELETFPFDKQTFRIRLVSPGYSSAEIKLVQDPDAASGIAERFSVADWTVISWEAGPEAVSLRNEDTAHVFSISFEAARQSGYFVVKVIVPLIFIVAMSWVVFWIDPKEAGTQINVSVTAMLTLIAYRFLVGMDLPKFAYLTRLDHFILFATILVFASLLEVVITSWFARTDKLALARAIDVWARWLFPLAFILFSLEVLVFHFFI